MKTWIKRSLLALGALTLAACGHHHYRSWADADITELKAKAVQRATRKLDLDAAQQAKAHALADALQAQRQALVGGQDKPLAQLQQLIQGRSFDRTAANALLASKLGSVQAQGPQVLNALADFYDALRPDQQGKLREMPQRGRHRDRDRTRS